MNSFSIVILASLVAAQSPGEPSRGVPGDNQARGTYLGVLVAPVPEAVYHQVPDLPKEQGVLITHVLPSSPAAAGGVLRNDILLKYGKVSVSSCSQLARLIQEDKPHHDIKLQVLRQGKARSIGVTLESGPPLILTTPQKGAAAPDSSTPKAVAKPGSSPSLVVSVTPLERSRLKVTFEYYQEGTGRLRTLVCQGNTEQLGQEIEKLPETHRPLARVILKRLQSLNAPAEKQPPKNSP